MDGNARDPFKVSRNLLDGITVLSLFPFFSSQPTGAWSRFSMLVRYLSQEGAHVIAPVIEVRDDVRLERVRFSYFRGQTPFQGAAMQELIRRYAAIPELKGASYDALYFTAALNPDVWKLCPGYEQWLAPLVAQADVVTVEYPFVVRFLQQSILQHDKPLILTCIDALFDLHGSHPAIRNAMEAAEIESYKHADSVFFLTPKDAELFAERGVAGKVVPLTGDVHAVRDPARPAPDGLLERLGLKLPFFLFVGNYHAPNIEAARLLHSLAEQAPEVGIVVAGGCAKPERDRNFAALGQVSAADLDALYRAATGVVIPLPRGGGMSVKFYEACAYGKAIVANSVGARGHAVSAGKEYVLCEYSGELLSVLRRLALAAEERVALGQAARAYAERSDFRSMLHPYGEEILRLLGRPRAQTKRAPPRARLLVVDSNLKDLGGHHWSYAEAVRAGAEKRGIEVHVLAHREFCNSAEQSAALPVFSTSYHEGAANPYPPHWVARLQYDWLHSNHEFLSELEPHLQSVAADDIVFLPNANHRQALAVAVLLHRYPVWVAPQFVLMFRYDLSSIALTEGGERGLVKDARAVELLQLSFKHLELAATPSNLRVVTDSERLRREYATLTSLPIEVFPIPHGSSREASVVRPHLRRDVPVIGYLGDARAEKGFGLLRDVLRLLCQRREKAVFRIQAYVSNPTHEAMRPVIEELARTAGPEMQLITSPLDTARYEQLVESLDAVLLPYDPLTYVNRSSGPFVEAVCAGKPVIVPSRTWMSEELATKGSGVTFDSWTPLDIALAVSTLLADFDSFHNKARASSHRYCEYHSTNNFASRLLD